MTQAQSERITTMNYDDTPEFSPIEDSIMATIEHNAFVSDIISRYSHLADQNQSND